MFLQGLALWVPIEKLFMNEIGFDAASVGVMAAAYAALVPIIEMPSGILADRWSRRGVLIGGLSDRVLTYIVSGMVLGVYFAMHSGTLDSIVYDTVLEETGDGEAFEKHIGRIRLVNSLALVASSLAGGWLALASTPRLTYFLTLPFLALSIVVLLRFDEPQLHKSSGTASLTSHIVTTYTTILQRGRQLPVVTLLVLTSLLLQMLFEFGPLWLVALATSTALYGPFTAGMVSALGLGGLLADRVQFDRPATLAPFVGLMALCGLVLVTSRSTLVVTIAQIVLAVLIVTASIFLTRLLHDAVSSTIRAGVASGVGTLPWIAFLPAALAFGLVSSQHGVHTAGWTITALTMLSGALLLEAAVRRDVEEPLTAPATALEAVRA